MIQILDLKYFEVSDAVNSKYFFNIFLLFVWFYIQSVISVSFKRKLNENKH